MFTIICIHLNIADWNVERLFLESYLLNDQFQWGSQVKSYDSFNTPLVLFGQRIGIHWLDRTLDEQSGIVCKHQPLLFLPLFQISSSIIPNQQMYNSDFSIVIRSDLVFLYYFLINCIPTHRIIKIPNLEFWAGEETTAGKRNERCSKN